MDPFLSTIAANYAENVIVCKVDTDQLYSVVKRYKPRGYPTVLLIKDGEEVERLLGTMPESHDISVLDKLLNETKQGLSK